MISQSRCLREKHPGTARDNIVQVIDRSFRLWLPTQSTNKLGIFLFEKTKRGKPQNLRRHVISQSRCLSEKHPSTAHDNIVQVIDRSFPLRRPLSQQTSSVFSFLRKLSKRNLIVSSVTKIIIERLLKRINISSIKHGHCHI